MFTPKETIKNQSLRKEKTDFYTIVYLSYYYDITTSARR